MEFPSSSLRLALSPLTETLSPLNFPSAEQIIYMSQTNSNSSLTMIFLNLGQTEIPLRTL
uniref:Uncharacterized protein n=1 Tax=Lepeophtheirus salmonis TaxID=72036 RepID=A0A0K2TC68_LEPSM